MWIHSAMRKVFHLYWMSVSIALTALVVLPLAHATPIKVVIDTSSRAGTAAALAFDFVDGGQPANSVIIFGFATDAILGAHSSIGDATGTLPGAVTFGDPSFFNEYIQNLTLGDVLTFIFDTTDNPASPTSFPDAFALFLRDQSTGLPLFTTGDPTGANALLLFNVGEDDSTQVYSSTVQAGPNLTRVVEYYNASLDHYFMTWIVDEIAKLDAGVIKGWARTGYSFKAFTGPQPGTSPVCRYYIPPALGDSHFYGRGTTECDATGQKNPSFVLEDPSFMQMFLPSDGVCPADTTPVYRVFDNRPDANHRYMTDPAVRDQMVALGWAAEGDGPDLVVMCAPQ